MKLRIAAPTVSAISCNGTSRMENRVEREFGARVFTTSKTKQRRLLNSRRVVAEKTPPVRLATSMPVKELVVPVLPPMLYLCQFSSAEAVRAVRDGKGR